MPGGCAVQAAGGTHEEVVDCVAWVGAWEGLGSCTRLWDGWEGHSLV